MSTKAAVTSLVRLLLVLLVLGLPLGASAQTDLPLSSRSGIPLALTQSHASAHRFADGSMLAALRLSGAVRIGRHMLGADRDDPLAVVLVRTDVRGRVAWALPLPGFDDARLVGLAGGDAIIGGHRAEGDHSATTLLRIDARGQEQWRWSAVPTGRFSTVTGLALRGGMLVASGTFTRGAFGLPGQERWRSPRYMTHWVARIDPRTGNAEWARRIAGGIEETHLAVAHDAAILFATHGRGRAGGQDLIVRRIEADGSRVSVIARWGSRRDDHPEGIRVVHDGFAVLSSNGANRNLVGFAADGTLRFAQALPRGSILASGDGPAFDVFAPGPIQERAREGMRFGWTNRGTLLRIDPQGTRMAETPIRGAWIVSTLRADGADGEMVLSGVAYERGPRVRLQRVATGARQIAGLPPPHTTF